MGSQALFVSFEGVNYFKKKLNNTEVIVTYMLSV